MMITSRIVLVFNQITSKSGTAISDEELADAHGSTLAVLFTYQTDSVLSSGALMNSLNSTAIIIGPDGGAFRDLAQEEYIEIYHDRSDIIETLDRALQNAKTVNEIIAKRAVFFKHTAGRQQLNE